MISDLVPLVLVAPLLVATIWCDMRLLLIPNRLVAAMVIMALVLVPVLVPWHDALLRCAISAAVFAVGFAGFSLKLIGGGDVKMLAALVLFVPPDRIAVFCLLLSAALLIGIALVQGLRQIAFRPTSGWGVLRERRRYPMGLSIGMTGLILPWIVT